MDNSLRADGKYEVTYQSNVVIGVDDSVSYNIYQVPPAIYKSSCEIDVKYFPFDEQVCKMKFGSWTFQAHQLNFSYTKFSGLDLTDYLKSGTWDLVDCPAHIEICVDQNTKQSKFLYIAEFRIRRKTLFYTVNLLIPCILISFVSISVFMLPPDTCEKITLIISILLALVVFLLLISKMLPPSLQIPLIAKYLMFDFLMNIIAIGSTVFVINRNYRTARTHRMPNWIRIVFLNYLPRILLMKRPKHDERWKKSPIDISELHASKSSLNINSVHVVRQSPLDKSELVETYIDREGDKEIQTLDCILNRTQENITRDEEESTFQLSREMIEATEAIAFMRRHLEWEDKYETVQEDWKYVAMVIDRLLLYIFIIVTVCGTLGILFQSPFILMHVDQDTIIEHLKNNADGKYEVSYQSNILVSFDTLVYWIPPAIYKSSCSIDVEYFPFDEQRCDMKFGSWTFTAEQLNFTFFNNMDSLDFTDYLKSGSWDIIKSPGKIDTIQDPMTGENKAMVIFQFVLRRKTLFYTVNLIIPCVLISFVSVCVFLLPADACEKITLCISVLLALVVFLLLISKILPPSKKIPLIANYLLFTFVMNILAICLTVFVINGNYRTPRTHRMPDWVRVVFLNYLPQILLMERPNHNERWKKSTEDIGTSSNSVCVTNREANTDGLLLNYHELTEHHHPNCKLNHRPSPKLNHKIERLPPPRYDTVTENPQFQMTPELHDATEALKFITEHLKAEDAYDTVLDDWKYVASVLDRLLLLIFLSVTFIGTIGILFQAPHILEFVDQDKILQELMAKYTNG